ncbi:MAG: hypothetical protein H0U18_02110 [Pyrinomonadaceae bacterium]|nr:hypothetical protein [Pyrinomonadaceae bacterium]
MNKYDVRKEPNFPRSLWIGANTELMVDETGVVRDRRDRFTQAILGVEVRRIRQCAVCQKILWADAMMRSVVLANVLMLDGRGFTVNAAAKVTIRGPG